MWCTPAIFPKTYSDVRRQPAWPRGQELKASSSLPRSIWLNPIYPDQQTRIPFANGHSIQRHLKSYKFFLESLPPGPNTYISRAWRKRQGRIALLDLSHSRARAFSRCVEQTWLGEEWNFRKVENHYLRAQTRTDPGFLCDKTDYLYITGLLRDLEDNHFSYTDSGTWTLKKEEQRNNYNLFSKEDNRKQQV